MEHEQNYCKLCGAKLENRSEDALYYCMKCNKQTNKEKTLKR